MPADIGSVARMRIGTTLRGKYRIDEVLGVGGMAVVFRATHRNNKEFAIKILRAEVSVDEELRRRFLREGYAANSVKHRGVVSVVDDDIDDDGCAFLVMELLEGESVDQMLGRMGTMEAPLAVSILIRVLDVLAAAHDKGILHRDVKPANIFVTRSGDVKVLDFGIARVRDGTSSATTTTTGAAVYGTPAFMAPEQALGKSQETDARSDVWQCAAALFNMLTGRFVHEGATAQHLLVLCATQPPRSIATVIPTIHPDLAAVIDRALAFDKEQRWAHAAAFRDALATASGRVFGGVQDDAGLATFAASIPRAVEPTRRVDLAAPPIGATTAQPISSERHDVMRPKRTIVALVVAACLGVAGLTIAIGVIVTRHPKQATPATTSAPLQTSPPPTSSATTEIPVVSITSLPIATTASARPKTTAPQTATQGAHPPASAAPNCSPNFWVDAEGDKHFKPECFK